MEFVYQYSKYNNSPVGNTCIIFLTFFVNTHFNNPNRFVFAQKKHRSVWKQHKQQNPEQNYGSSSTGQQREISLSRFGALCCCCGWRTERTPPKTGNMLWWKLVLIFRQTVSQNSFCWNGGSTSTKLFQLVWRDSDNFQALFQWGTRCHDCMLSGYCISINSLLQLWIDIE